METDFTYDVEIPVRVFCSFNKASGDGWNEPYIPAHVSIDDIELPEDVKGYIEKKYYDDFVREAEESR